MSSKMMMWLSWIYLSCTICFLIIEGKVFNADDVNTVNSLTGFSAMEIQSYGGFGFIVQGAGFMIHGLPKMITWDYPFLEGKFAIVKWVVFYPITIAVVYAHRSEIASAANGILSRIRSII